MPNRQFDEAVHVPESNPGGTATSAAVALTAVGVLAAAGLLMRHALRPAPVRVKAAKHDVWRTTTDERYARAAVEVERRAAEQRRYREQLLQHQREQARRVQEALRVGFGVRPNPQATHGAGAGSDPHITGRRMQQLLHARTAEGVLLASLPAEVRQCASELGIAKQRICSADVKQAYYKLAKRFHPDMASTEAQRSEAETSFKRISEAYEQLRAHVGNTA